MSYSFSGDVLEAEYFVGYRLPRRRWELKSDPTIDRRVALRIYKTISYMEMDQHGIGRRPSNSSTLGTSFYEKKGDKIRKVPWSELERIMEEEGLMRRGFLFIK